MFELEQIKSAHAKVKSGADFPKYMAELRELGIVNYETFVADGHTVYYGSDNYQITSEAKYSEQIIATKSDIDKFKHYLQIHQQGQTDYPTFCAHSAETGVEKWIVNMAQKTCSYYDLQGNEMLVEKVPG